MSKLSSVLILGAKGVSTDSIMNLVAQPEMSWRKSPCQLILDFNAILLESWVHTEGFEWHMSMYREGRLRFSVRYPSFTCWKTTCEKQPEEEEETSRQALGTSEPTLRSSKSNKERQSDFEWLCTSSCHLNPFTARLRNKNSWGYISSMALYMNLRQSANSPVPLFGFLALFFTYYEDDTNIREPPRTA